ncbi:MAG: carboxypeptidase regulatory-like domain-containing protein, partial [Tannerella sp.]|nr:carboxypeptidase regulatory-like domain-containing protein [Tannerella sp.]
MTNERIIKVFMASSDELKEDRIDFGNFVQRLNKRDFSVELLQWEDFDASLSRRRKQEEYNDKVRESDLFIAFFHRKAGEYTVEEFDVAVAYYT